MQPVRLELTTAEAQALRQLIDMALRARGMDVARAALVLDDKIATALDAAAKPADNKDAADA